jgi:peptidoglycan/LPS O-acetylase OafA/YrhL
MNVEMKRIVPGQAAAGQVAAGVGRIGELEVLRTVAILMVLVQHLPFNLMFWMSRFTGPLFYAGTWSGVDLFFAVSGFVIARGLLPQLEGVRDFRKFLHITITFWIRRAWRLWPSAWFWLAAPLVLCLAFNRSGAYGNLLANWQMAMAGFSNLANFYVAQHVIFKPGTHGTAFAQWSLSLEEQFYILLPFAVLLLRRYLPLLMGALLILAFFTPMSAVMLNIRSGAFAAGVLLAIASRHPAYGDCAPVFLAQTRLGRIATLLGGVALLVSIGDVSWRMLSFMLGPIAVVSGLLVWVASYGQGYLWRPGWSRRVVEMVAARSYSIYLVHIPVYFAMHEAFYRMYGPGVPSHWQAVAYFAIAPFLLALVTELNHRLLEVPLREHGKRVARAYARRMREITP